MLNIKSRIPLIKARHFAPGMQLDDITLHHIENKSARASAQEIDNDNVSTNSLPVITMISIVFAAIVFLCWTMLPDILLKRKGYQPVSN